MDIHLKVQYVINIVCIQRTSTFQTEPVAKRMQILEALVLLTGSNFNFHVV